VVARRRRTDRVRRARMEAMLWATAGVVKGWVDGKVNILIDFG
jgi:hypothetical protein